MKKIILTTLMSLVSFICFSQKVYFECNIYTINKQLKQTKTIPLYEEAGRVMIPNTIYKNQNSGGLLIYHHVFDDVYFAYDRYCQECFQKDGVKHKITMQTSFMGECAVTAECTRCHSEYQNISHGSNQQTNRSGKYYLIQYVVEREGNKLIITSN